VGGAREKDVALAVAVRLKAALERDQPGVRIFLTRDADRDVTLDDRVLGARARKPDLLVSLHANSMATRKQRERMHGIETFFLADYATGEDARSTAHRENEDARSRLPSAPQDTLSFILADLARAQAHVDSSNLAYVVHQRLIAETGANDRGVQQAPFFVLTGVEAPAILVEMGFISHPNEGRRLKDVQYQERLARAIAKGVGTFLNQLRERDGRRASAASSTP
jgi:N-acetylmuramoyl-L-alanine amidase